jgi:hypothetical protein
MQPAMTIYRAHEKTPGQIAYEADCAARPYYGDGARRKKWEQLPAYAQWSWERNPTAIEPHAIIAPAIIAR